MKINHPKYFLYAENSLTNRIEAAHNDPGGEFNNTNPETVKSFNGRPYRFQDYLETNAGHAQAVFMRLQSPVLIHIRDSDLAVKLWPQINLN